MTDAPELLAVEQIDRDAAHEYLRANDRAKRSDAQQIYDAITTGRIDELPIVQAFARHRTAALAARPEGWPFQRGDKIIKLKGHSFGNGDAKVVICYQTLAGEWRVVAEHPEGWQFIFSPSQIAATPPEPKQ